MAQISLSKRENDFLRDMLMICKRHYQIEIEADKTLISSCEDDNLKVIYEDMLRNDASRLSYLNDMYNKLTEAL